ncbi:MAG: UDP-N-acetylmuramate--L-alanine ligase [Actinomycetaceae bacterium]|nr:UDP-N-acetylmuramate--L-alanine ligase [Actinomycetaceae bacterium]MDU0970043.1 UDP-N-acetylmuramate--L-alanine ligase [Actinomycetaceae bacterium]
MTTHHFHLIGAGGAGMSVVGELLTARGLVVTGSDQQDSAALDRVRRSGATVWVGHDPDHVDPDATIVVSSAIRESDPELALARSRGQRVIHRSQALALAAAGMDFVAVAGTHGKTTTSGMIAAALIEAGEDPSFAVGSVVTGIGSGAHLGSGRVFVAEADESDGSFLNYSPTVAVVTNIEPDHLDHYGTVQAFEQAFADFAQRIVPGGSLVTCADDPGARALAQSVADSVRVVTFGTSPAPAGAARHLALTDITEDATGSTATVTIDQAQFTLCVPVPGAHNVLNAAAALAAGIELGVDTEAMIAGLAAFKGTGRRFEFRGEAGGVRVFDDYAHHPTEVRALVEQARLAAGDGRVLVLFQPHLYSRTRNFAADFADALRVADDAVVADIYGSREDPIEGVSSRLITDHLGPGAYGGPLKDAARILADRAREGDVVVTVGAGSVTEAGPCILERCAAKETGRG